MTSDVSSTYPAAPTRGGVTEIIHGVVIRDPYRGLEDPDNVATKDFVSAQNQLADTYLSSHPSRPSFNDSVRLDLLRSRSSCPALQSDGYYYWLHSDASSSREVMVRSRNLEADYGQSPLRTFDVPERRQTLQGHDVYALRSGPELVFDPTSEAGMSLYAYTWSPCGGYFCAVLQNAGSDWQNIRLFSTSSTPFIPLEPDLTGAKFTFGATFLGSDGILYKRLIDTHHPPPPGAGVDGKFGLFYHRIGTKQEADVLVWHGVVEDGNSLIMGHFKVISSDLKGNAKGDQARKWLVVDTYKDTTPDSELWVVEIPPDLAEEPTSVLPDLVKSESRWITRGFSGMTVYIGSTKSGKHIFTSTSDGRTGGSIVYFTTTAYDASEPNSSLPLEELVPPHPEGLVLRSANLVGDRLLVLVYLRHACALVVFVDAVTGQAIDKSERNNVKPVIDDNGACDIPLHADISRVTSRSDSNDFYMSVDTFTSPPYVLRGSLRINGADIGLQVDISRLGRTLSNLEPMPSDIACEQVFYPSFDGTLIPMFICHLSTRPLPQASRPPVPINATSPQKSVPTLIHAYGGYATPVLPFYSPFFAAWIRHFGGIVAVANIRGGGEYGDSWHRAAMGHKRTVAFDDFAYAAKYLQETLKVTEPSMTAAYGTSNGGLLVAATLARWPSLWSVGFPDVPVTDMCRFHLFTIGKLWIGEFGDPSSPSDLPYLHSYSPYHNADPVRAAMLVTTGVNDTRVIPGHALKYIAALQARRRAKLPLTLARVYHGAGHEGGGKTIEQKVEEIVDRLVFASINLRRGT